MALTSFTIRKTTVGFGSSLRKASVDDNSLRADGVLTSGIQAIGDNEFSANIISDGVVRLSWTLSEALVDESTISTGTDPTQLVIVSSTRGEPITIDDGTILTRVYFNTTDTFYDDTPIIQEGRWVYYTLFVRYSDGTDHWYSSAGSLYIQIPKAYNSTQDLWRRIPEYYRELDYQQEPLVSGNGPLYTFLDLIGDEVDRTRTLIDTIALSNDPEIAVTPALEQLAIETGLEIGINDLGTSKARSLLSSIGYLRQRKGTIGSILSYISSLTGCVVEYEYDAGAASFPHIFHIYAKRMNFVSDPRFQQATITPSTATVSADKYTLQTTPTWGVYTYGAATAGASVTPAITNTQDGIRLDFPAGSYSNRTVLVYPRIPFPYVRTNQYGTAFNVTISSASFNAVHTSTDTARISWEAGVAAASAPPSPLYQDGSWITTASYTQASTAQRYSLDYSPSTSASFSFVNSVPVLEFTAAPGSTIFVGQWLWEPGVAGEFFDGSTREGGYIPINTGAAGQGTFDYYWGAGGANQDYSYYILDRERTVNTTERILEDYVIPVTMLDDYELDWNYYVGNP